MPVDSLDMALVHRVFRNELHNAVDLVREVGVGDTARSAVVGDHLTFIVAALHHHHAAEDDLIWPKLHARVPSRAAEITRMEDQHQRIADNVHTVQTLVPSWARSPDPHLTEQLATAVENLSASVDEHLADEERNVVPLITEHVSEAEWREATDRGAEFLSRKNLRLGLVLGGYVLDAASADERRRFMANVPLPKRILAQLLGIRVLNRYRKRLST